MTVFGCFDAVFEERCWSDWPPRHSYASRYSAVCSH